MKKYILFLTPFIMGLILSHTPSNFAYAKGLFMGTIQFPDSISELDNLRIYCGGNKISCEPNNRTKKVTFAIPDDKLKARFFVLITETIAWKLIEDTNTIEYLTISPTQPYKFYILDLVKVAVAPKNSDSSRDTKNEITHQWSIAQAAMSLDSDGRIPDDTIIICYNPDYIETLHGGNSIELPTITVRSDIVKLAGSEAKLHDSSISLLLSSLDYDAIHATIQQEVKQDYHRTRVTLLT